MDKPTSFTQPEPTDAPQPVATPAPRAQAVAQPPVAAAPAAESQGEIVQMLQNKGAESRWETITYKWQPAIRALGHAYDLRRVDAAGNVIETRAKVNNRAPVQPAMVAGVSATRLNPNMEFERWWMASGNTDGDTKAEENNAFLAGWFARQNAR